MTQTCNIPVIVLAGGTAKPELQQVIGVPVRALAQFQGKTLIQAVLDALQPYFSNIFVIGSLPDMPGCTMLPDLGSFTENLFEGLLAAQEAPYCIIATADLPFLQQEMVQQLLHDSLALAQANNAALVWPIVPVELCQQRFPGIRRTSLKLKEGRFTGGNLALIKTSEMLQCRSIVTQAYQARKSPLRLASMLGGKTVLQLILSQCLAPRIMSIISLEKAVSRLIGANSSALLSAHPEIATDLDRPSDFQAFRLKP